MRTSFSCASCAKRKRKCDLRKPACNRCIKLKIDCIWPSRERNLNNVHHQCRLSRGAKPSIFKEIGSCISTQAVKHTRSPAQYAGNAIYYEETSICPAAFHNEATKRSNDLYSEDKPQSRYSLYPYVGEQSTSRLGESNPEKWVTDRSREIPGVNTLSLDTQTVIPYDCVSPPDQMEISTAAGYKPVISSLEGISTGVKHKPVDESMCSQLDQSRFLSRTEVNTIEGNSLSQNPISKEDIYINLFFTYFCTEWSVFAGQDLWRTSLAAYMSSNLGIHNAVLGVASMYYHRTRSIGGSDTFVYYHKGVKGVQQSLNRSVEMQGGADEATIIGVTLLMVYELLSGSVRGYLSHLRALCYILQYAGALNCRYGMYRLVFLTVIIPSINCSVIQEQDCVFADEDWIATLYAVLPPRFADVLSMYARAARAAYLHIALLKREIMFSSVIYDGNRQTALCVLEELRGFYQGYRILGFPSKVEGHENTPKLNCSPFQPSLQLMDTRSSTNFPTLVANIIHLERVFGFASEIQQNILVRELIQVAQHIIFSLIDSGALLQQVWPLILARSCICDPTELSWLDKLEQIVQVKGFGIATASDRVPVRRQALSSSGG